MTDYMDAYRDFWKEIVERPDGTLNLDQVARELSDLLTLQRHLTKIYCEVSRGQVSKPFTLPSVVTAMYQESLTEAADEAIRELIADLEKGDGGPFASTAEVVALIRELTGVAAPPDPHRRDQ